MRLAESVKCREKAYSFSDFSSVTIVSNFHPEAEFMNVRGEIQMIPESAYKSSASKN